jgi:signal transduction histidine kinase
MGMKERLGLIGGKVHIQTAPGEGTTVTASVDPDKELLQ